jgi:hypothetical protein
MSSEEEIIEDWKSMTDPVEVNAYIAKLNTDERFEFYTLLLAAFIAWYCRSDTGKHYVRRRRNHKLDIDETAPHWLQHGSHWLEKLGEWIQARRQDYVKYKYKTTKHTSTTASKWMIRFNWMNKRFPFWYDPTRYRNTPLSERMEKEQEDVAITTVDTREVVYSLFDKHIRIVPYADLLKLVRFDMFVLLETQSGVKRYMEWDKVKCKCLPNKRDIVPIEIDSEGTICIKNVNNINDYTCEYSGQLCADFIGAHNLVATVKDVDKKTKNIRLTDIRIRKIARFIQKVCDAHKFDEHRQLLVEQIHFQPSELRAFLEDPKKMRKGRFTGLSSAFLPPPARKRPRKEEEEQEEGEEEEEEEDTSDCIPI